MREPLEPGLGELLRHLTELTDGSAERWYRDQGLDYRPRFTPIMRALSAGPASVSQIKDKLAISQGAVSQSVKLMQAAGLIDKRRGEDARQSILCLSEDGRALLRELEPHWSATFGAVAALEEEIRLPLATGLKRAIGALERVPFADRIRDSAAATAEPPAAHANPFCGGGEQYARYRPSYPPELAASLSRLVGQRALALDVGCGSGQLTALLANHFEQVIGTDASQDQLAHAQRRDNIRYRVEAAERIGLPADSVDLITVAQAAHWFDLDQFYAEARRVARRDAVIALISYGVPYIADPVNACFQRGYWQDTHAFWPAARRHVENGYAELYFPFARLDVPAHSCRVEMGIEPFIHYIRTWSAYGQASASGQSQRFEAFFEALRAAWGFGVKEVVWPISARIGKLEPAEARR